MNTERNLKVYSTTRTRTTSYYHTEYKEIPMILLKGQWLESAGFHTSDNILITVRDNKLVITKKDIDN